MNTWKYTIRVKQINTLNYENFIKPISKCLFNFLIYSVFDVVYKKKLFEKIVYYLWILYYFLTINITYAIYMINIKF